VRAAIEQVCGAPVTEARDKPGGFSPGMAARVRCADGTEWFVKAASAEVNPHTPGCTARRQTCSPGWTR
jgi:hypothetical protein